MGLRAVTGSWYDYRHISAGRGMAARAVFMDSHVAEAPSAVIARGLADGFRRVKDKVHLLVEPLSTEELWHRPFPYGNSIGHLLLHVTGNLRYYVGARIAASGYVRDRPREFDESSRRPKDDVLREFDDAVAMVISTLAAQSPADWQAPYEAAGAEGVKERFTMFVRCATHAELHLGQMIYLCKQLSPSKLPEP